MKKYKELTVCRITDPACESPHNYCAELYACRGKACNEMRRYRNYYKGKTIKEERILYRENPPENGSVLWRSCSETDWRTTSWYTSEEEAVNAAAELQLDHPVTICRYYDAKLIDPLPQKFHAQFQLDKQGRPYVRFDAHPERDGYSRNGKIFFPDRSFVGADEGDAVISVSKEFDTYGFVSGKMVEFGMPGMEEFLDWAWENQDPETNVVFINHPGRGKYLALEDEKNDGKLVRVICDPDCISTENFCDPIVQKDAVRYAERKCSLTELYLEDAWGQPVDLDTVKKLFNNPESMFQIGRICWDQSVKYWGPTIDRARRDGLFKQYRVSGHQIEAVEIFYDSLYSLARLPFDEAKKLAAEVNEINAAAENSIKALIRKGKI